MSECIADRACQCVIGSLLVDRPFVLTLQSLQSVSDANATNFKAKVDDLDLLELFSVPRLALEFRKRGLVRKVLICKTVGIAWISNTEVSLSN